MQSTFFIWDADPVLFTFFSFSVRWYSLLFATGFMAGYLIIQRIYLREKKSVEDLDNLLLYMFIGTVAGARLGHCLFYEPLYYLKHPLEIFMVWKGGLASHGGAAGIFIALYLYSRRSAGQGYLWLLDRMAIVIPLCGSMIRLGNFFNSEITGVKTTVPWAVMFARIDYFPRHPVQLYESVAYLMIFILLLSVYLIKDKVDGLLSGLFLVLVFSVRFFLEYFKVRQTDILENMALNMGQVLSLPVIVCGICLLFFHVRNYRG